MVECGRTARYGILPSTLCIVVSVFHIVTREAAQAAKISLDVSGLRINPLECYDRVKACPKMADNDYCVSNYHYMIDRCPWSCRFCRRARGDNDKCEDISERCSEWVSNKECTTRPDFMAQNCKKSCEMCGPESEYKVTDSVSICPIWAKAGWCQKNSDLLQKCPHSCQKYGYMGANSLEERYITVNFQNTSSVKTPTVTEIVAPPPPSAAIRAHSDLESLPPDLRNVLEKEWLDSKLLQLTQKQNEYVTHPEFRPPSLPLYTNQTARAGNNSLGTTQLDDNRQSNGSHEVNTSQDGNQRGEMLQLPTPPAPPPRPYDSLLPQLALGGLTWNGKTEGNLASAAQKTNTGNEVWKEEKEEDEDQDEGGQQKGKVPIIVSGNDESSGNPQHLSAEMSSSGNEEMQSEGDYENEMKASGDNIKQDDWKTEQNMALSGSGEEDESNNLHLSMYISPENGHGDNIRRIFPENNFSGSEQPEKQETRDSIEAGSSGSGQYQRDERLELTKFSGSGE